ncbi:glycosyltransferase [Lachnoclostridium phytofermentans]|uniref:Glycosyl transferase family 2 n=1 Tax=Lachnoclostridium phytofermentans (strain ATCC 700394 / DSM 18823 / ISDg) TaxID=357809 RepID=A9KRJ3_LACP7|nr:glycosyltransferase family 2 protein [Lachnoclostridium phytofermentans]ABX42067.1 glycosyl transferase family 2 [Lachnoclostridium phytofermentans ISDg]
MITISLCMIVKNEEDVLSRCLESAKDVVDEIIMVDTGSTDKTKEIAYQYTDKVYDFEWANDFSLARNYSFSKATKEYQMWLDADDIITEEDKQKILKLKSELDTNIDIVTFKYNTHFDKDNNPILTSTRGRLFKREKNYVWNDPIHEYVELRGNIYYANDIFITHKKEATYTDRNLKIYENQVQEGKKLSPRSLYYFARELKDHKRYIEAIYYFEQFLEGKLGWVEDNIASCYSLALCYKMLNQEDKVLKSLIRSFNYDAPRAEICCEFGYFYINKNDYQKASKWFLLATHLEKPNTLGFLLNDYWGFIPNLELSVCYDKLGEIEKAVLFNEAAAKYKPNSNAVLYNRNYFASLKQDKSY